MNRLISRGRVAGFRKAAAMGLKSGDALDCRKWIAACGEQVGRSNSRQNASRGSRFGRRGESVCQVKAEASETKLYLESPA